jgi:hypothetical protein
MMSPVKQFAVSLRREDGVTTGQGRIYLGAFAMGEDIDYHVGVNSDVGNLVVIVFAVFFVVGDAGFCFGFVWWVGGAADVSGAGLGFGELG